MAAALAGSYGGDVTVPPINTTAYSAELDAAIRSGEEIGGSTGARIVSFRGQTYIYKRGPVEHIVNEFVAFLLYSAAGVSVPHVTLVYNTLADNIPMGILLEYITGVSVADALGSMTALQWSRVIAALQRDMVIHALFANWDAINSENHMIPAVDRWDSPVAIDLGGALFFRAMGEPKADRDFMSGSVLELRTIPEYSAETRSKIYEALSNVELMRTIVCSRWTSVSAERILATIDALKPFLRYLPRGEELRSIIESRCAYITRMCSTNTPLSATINHSTLEKSLLKEMVRPVMRRRRLSTSKQNIRSADFENVSFPAIMSNAKKERISPVDEEDEYYFGNFYKNNTSSINSEQNYPHPSFTIKDGGPVANILLAMRSGSRIKAWMKAQTDYIFDTLSIRERDILISYTRTGDVLVNNYLRGLLPSDMTTMLERTLEAESNNERMLRPVPLAYAIYDRYPMLVRDKKIKIADWGTGYPSDLLDEGNRSGTILSMDKVRHLIRINMGFFGQRVNAIEFLELYYQDLRRIFERAPRLPEKLTVFRGIKSEKYLRGLTFRTPDFLSTSVSPDSALTHFTEVISDNRDIMKESYHCCVYELNVTESVPCMYLQAISQFQSEYEVLIAPGAMVTLSDTVRIKYNLPITEGVKTIEDIRRKILTGGARRVAVIEGQIRTGGGKDKRDYPTLVFDKEAIRKSRKRSVSSEHFSAQKPRTMKQRNGRRWVPEWKVDRDRRTRRR